MKNYAIYSLKVTLFILCICIGYSCSSHKDTATSRGMQNLTARYNYIYNSKVILTNHQTELTETYVDNYDQVLPVYLGPVVDNSQINSSLNLKPMDDIIKKAEVIILEKSYSNYIDEAYILLGKANFFNGNYFNAAEYFDYTAKTYKTNQKSYLEALNWKARSLMQLKRLSEANQVLDTLEAVMPTIKSKRSLSEPYATLAQMCIYLKNDTAAISYLKNAIKASGQSENKIRWTYILAQLYEKQNDYTNAATNYRRVERSNAPFEMYFNANLSQIKLRTLQSGSKINKQKQLLALLRDDKNFDYTDQVYFQVAESHSVDEEYQEAEKYYQLSIQKSTTNQFQKGLSYLRIADLNFKYFKDYLRAKSYYDSTVNTLPKTYPGYDLILKKNANLQYLTNRYEIIELQDTLQAIAKMPEESRAEKLQALANPVITDLLQNPAITSSLNYQPTYNTGANSKAQSQNAFYFSNPMAVSIGFSDFKKRWGNRKLENNWRQSIRTSTQETTQELAGAINGTPADPDHAASITPDKDALIKQYTAELPLSPTLLANSNQKIIDAYYQIASFYLQELDDPKEAAVVYQILMDRFPQNNYAVAVYYSLYLIHTKTDAVKAETFKNRILKDFPNSQYAKTIIDPSFSLKQSELETAIINKYNDIFGHYEKKEFSAVISRVDESAKTNTTTLQPQFAYLKAISIGRTNNVDSLLFALNNITASYPEDKLITPLVKNHVEYINQHLAEFRKRKIALTDFDPNEPPFSGQIRSADPVIKSEQQTTPPVTAQVTEPVKPVEKTKPKQVEVVTTPKTDSVVKSAEPDQPAAPVIKTDGTFNNAASSTYYFIIDVADASLTLSSSRFGIGQFNRGNYNGSNLKHQLKEFDNDQLIYVGNFANFEDAKSYAWGITPQLKQIMKVPVNIYSTFIISKENFDKLTSKELLDKYIEFYKNNY